MNTVELSNSGLSRAGFSLVETVIAMAVVTVIIFAATEGTLWMSKNNHQMANTSMQAAGNATGSTAFGMSFATANIAVQYEHLPVPNGAQNGYSGCAWDTSKVNTLADAGPCTATMVGNNLVAGAIAGLGTPAAPVSWVEFFRDDNAFIVPPANPNGEIPFTPAMGSVNSFVQRTNPISQENLTTVAAGGVNPFVAWPFVPNDIQHQPLLVLSGSTASDPLIFVNNTSFGPPGPAGVGRWTLMQATNFTTSVQQIQGALYLIYNAFDPTQYVFQYAAQVQDCQAGVPQATTCYLTGGNSIPGLPANFVNGAPPWNANPIQWFQDENVNDPNQNNIHYFAVDLEPVDPIVLATGALAGGAVLPAQYYVNPANTNWLQTYCGANCAWGQWPQNFSGAAYAAPAFYPFLSQFSSIIDFDYLPGNTWSNPAFFEPFAGLNPTIPAAIDIRMIARYLKTPYNTASSGTSAPLVAVPVTIQSFDLSPAPKTRRCSTVGQSATVPCSTWDFVSTTISSLNFGAAPTVRTTTLMSDLPLDGTGGTPQGAVVVARPIGGGPTFQLFYFKPNNVTVVQ